MPSYNYSREGVSNAPVKQPVQYINVPGEGRYRYDPNVTTSPKLPIDMTKSFISQDPRATLVRPNQNNAVGFLNTPNQVRRRKQVTNKRKPTTTKKKTVKRTTRAKKK